MSRYYLYRHIRTDSNVPFYIGIGTKRSRNINPCFSNEYERAFDKGRRSEHWRRIFNICEGAIDIDILYESQSSDEIKQKEIEFIKLYGRVDLKTGTLVNFTNGGEGVFNYVPSEETKKRISSSMLAKKIKRSEETIEKIRKANKGQKPSEETIKKGILHNTGKKQSKESIEKRAAKIRGTKRSPEVCKKISAALKGKKRGPRRKEIILKAIESRKWYKPSLETKAKIAASNTGKKHSDETRNKMKKAWATRSRIVPDEVKIKISQSLTGKKRGPMSIENRKKLSEAHKGIKASKETRLKMSLAKKGKQIHTEESKIKIGTASKQRWANKKKEWI